MKKKILIIILSVIYIILLLWLIEFFIIIGVLFGKIEEYKYLKISNENKQNIIELLKEQEQNMFRISGKVKLDTCYDNLNKIEVVYRFPDGEDYTLYCNNEKFEFSRDDSNYDLPKYINENGKSWFRIKW